MNIIIRNFCKAEGFKTVKEFRSFFEYYIIGWGELDDDFSPETKRIAKTKTCAKWKKWYKEITDEEIQEALVTEEEAETAKAIWEARIHELNEEENKKTEEEKAAENEAELQLRDAGYEYDNTKTWEENIALYAENPPMKIKEIKETRQIRYRKKNLIQKAFLFNKKTDADILQKLSAVENQTGYIKGLIRKDIEETDIEKEFEE